MDGMVDDDDEANVRIGMEWMNERSGGGREETGPDRRVLVTTTTTTVVPAVAVAHWRVEWWGPPSVRSFIHSSVGRLVGGCCCWMNECVMWLVG